MGRRKKDSVTRCFNIEKNIYNLLEHLTEDGFLTLTQAIEKSIKGRFISEFGQEKFNKIMNKVSKDDYNKKEKSRNTSPKNELTEEQEMEELERLKEARRLRKLGDSNV